MSSMNGSFTKELRDDKAELKTIDIKDTPSIVHVLDRHAVQRPDDVLYPFLRDGEDIEAQWTFQELSTRAKVIASNIAGRARVGDRALPMYPAGLEYIAAFMACLYAGLIAVPAYPPRRNKLSSRLDAIVDDSSTHLILTTDSLADDVRHGLQRGSEFESERLVIIDAPGASSCAHNSTGGRDCG